MLNVNYRDIPFQIMIIFDLQIHFLRCHRRIQSTFTNFGNMPNLFQISLGLVRNNQGLFIKNKEILTYRLLKKYIIGILNRFRPYELYIFLIRIIKIISDKNSDFLVCFDTKKKKNKDIKSFF